MNLFSVIVKTVVPFFIPLIFYIPDTHISLSAKWVIVLLAALIDGIFYFYLENKEKGKKLETFKDRSARIAYSHLYELNELKRDSYIDHVADGNSDQIYDAVKYLKAISHSFRDVIGEINGIEKEHMHCTFIYKIQGADNWCWATQRESTFRSAPEDFFQTKDTVFYQLMNPDDENQYTNFVFYNDKEKMAPKQLYHMGARDEMYGRIGSILGVRCGFSSNSACLVEGILIVTSYGKRFVEDNNDEKVKELKRLISDVLLPCYERMMEMEMGAIYFEHQKAVKAAKENGNIESPEESPSDEKNEPMQCLEESKEN